MAPLPPQWLHEKLLPGVRPLPWHSRHGLAGSLTVTAPFPPQTVQVIREAGCTPLPRQYAHLATGSSTKTMPFPPQTWHLARDERRSNGSCPFPSQNAHLTAAISSPFVPPGAVTSLDGSEGSLEVLHLNGAAVGQEPP